MCAVLAREMPMEEGKINIAEIDITEIEGIAKAVNITPEKLNITPEEFEKIKEMIGAPPVLNITAEQLEKIKEMVGKIEARGEEVVERCIKELVARNLTEEEAKERCVAIATPLIPPAHPAALPTEISKCAEYEEKIGDLKERLAKATPEEAREIEKNVEELLREFERCLSAQAPTAAPIVEAAAEMAEECIEKHMKELNISKAEAMSRCVPISAAPVATQVGIIQKCKEIEKEVRELMRKLEVAPPEESERIKTEIERLRQEYAICIERPAVAPKPVVPYDPCEESRFLETSLKALEEKYAVVKEMYENGTISRDELLRYEIELGHTKEKLEKVRKACERKEIPVETPCARLEGLQRMYEELKIKIEMTKLAERGRLYDKLSSLLSEIEKLEKECREKSISAAEVTSIVDIQKAYETKMGEVFERAIEENKTKEEIIEELKEIEEEKKELIKEFAKRIKELEVKKQELIKKLKISENVSADGIPLEVQKIKIEVAGKEIEIAPGKEVSIVHRGIKSRGKLELEYTNGTLVGTLSKKELKVLPDAVIEKVKPRETVVNITINETEKELKYIATAEKVGKILWIFPVKAKVEYEIDATTGVVIKERRPWWDFFVTH